MGQKEVKVPLASGARGQNLRWPRSKPSGALRIAFRLPIYLYRLDLGWLLGHRGRKGGLPRQTVLEVVLYDPAIRESVVLSAWGEDADWYRNPQKCPAIEIRTGRESYEPLQRFVALQRKPMPRWPATSTVIAWRPGYSVGCSVTHSAGPKQRDEPSQNRCVWWLSVRPRKEE
jgi:deazaflavin-dependent oxidoreductase (nitroreductase family)